MGKGWALPMSRWRGSGAQDRMYLDRRAERYQHLDRILNEVGPRWENEWKPVLIERGPARSPRRLSTAEQRRVDRGDRTPAAPHDRSVDHSREYQLLGGGRRPFLRLLQRALPARGRHRGLSAVAGFRDPIGGHQPPAVDAQPPGPPGAITTAASPWPPQWCPTPAGS